MANLVTDLATALRDAMRANTTLQSLLGVADGVTYHVESGGVPDSYPTGAAGRCFIRLASIEHLDVREGSASVRYTFGCLFDLVDVRGQASALAAVSMGLTNLLADGGSAIFDTYFTDNGSNRLGKSGVWRLQDVGIEALQGLEDADRPVVLATVACELTHQLALA